MEECLLDAIVHGDAASRLVYADWLEQRGDLARAEFLRVQEQLVEIPADHPERRELVSEAIERLRLLAESVDLAWRMKVSRAGVQPCNRSACRVGWGGLVLTSSPNIRTCR